MQALYGGHRGNVKGFSGYCYYLHSPNEKTEAQKGSGTHSKASVYVIAELKFTSEAQIPHLVFFFS